MREGVTYKRLGEVAPSQKYDGEITSVSGLYWLLNLDMVEPNTGNVIKKVMATKEELDGSITSFSPNNVLYSKLRPYLNKVVLPDECGYCTTELVPLSPKKDLLSREYLAYFLRSNTFVEFINDKVAGAKMPRVKMSDFWNHPIPVPSLSTQELIADELDSISSVISAKKQQVLELDNLVQAIFLDTFGDPITNPKGWEIVKLGSLFSIGSSKRVYQSEWQNKGVPFYRAREVVKLARDGYVNNELFISEELFEKYSKIYGLPQEDDILVTAVGTLGITYIVKKSDRFYYKDGNIICLHKNSDVNSIYVDFCFKMPFVRSQIDNWNGATVGTYTIEKANQTKIPLPPLSLQQAFAEKVQAIEEQKRLINQSIAEFESLLAQRMEFHFA